VSHLGDTLERRPPQYSRQRLKLTPWVMVAASVDPGVGGALSAIVSSRERETAPGPPSGVVSSSSVRPRAGGLLVGRLVTRVPGERIGSYGPQSIERAA
jgi:hypothetical protein